MNQQDKIDLSKRVSEKFGLEPYQIANGSGSVGFSLADDDARCFRLALDNNVSTYINNLHVQCNMALSSFVEEPISNHSDRYEATRIAILKCLDAMKV